MRFVRVWVKFLGLKVFRLLIFFLMLMVWIGRLNLFVSVMRMLFLVVLLSLVIMRFEILVSFWKVLICESVFWFVVVFRIKIVLCGVVLFFL